MLHVVQKLLSCPTSTEGVVVRQVRFHGYAECGRGTLGYQRAALQRIGWFNDVGVERADRR